MSNYHKDRIRFTVKVVIVALLLVVSFKSFSMRCGTHLINEGDNVARMVALCGQPTTNTFSNVTYINKDGDGMNYYIHVDTNGIIDDIQFSRG
jgi:hypothetical protein